MDEEPTTSMPWKRAPKLRQRPTMEDKKVTPAKSRARQVPNSVLDLRHAPIDGEIHAGDI
jgi:hypothetical protein